MYITRFKELIYLNYWQRKENLNVMPAIMVTDEKVIRITHHAKSLGSNAKRALAGYN